jgi:hypothetical protein
VREQLASHSLLTHASKPRRKSLTPKSKGNAPPHNSLIIRLPVNIPPGHAAYVTPPLPIPDDLKAAILEKHHAWAQANTTETAELADPIEDELDALEQQAKDISLEQFKVWKFGERGYGNM